MDSANFLFEVSWEVCNKVGGIYTVLRSKLKQVHKHFGNNYIMIGPLRDQNSDFVEYQVVPETLVKIQQVLIQHNIRYRLGYWNIDERPTVILLEFLEQYNIDILLYGLWADFGVDSLASNYEYHEPILFSTAAGEVIEIISAVLTGNKIIAHFHEWLCGAGALYLSKHCNTVATVFTTHATVLGRSLASWNKLIYDLPATFDPDAEARRHNVFAKHSLERASAREVDCFTTVSTITADETNIMLGKYPDKIVPNGLDLENNQHWELTVAISETRAKLLNIASKVVGQHIPANALLWFTSGRYEFHNKGFDVLIKSLVQLLGDLPEDAPPIVVFYLIASSHRTSKDSLLTDGVDDVEQNAALGLATHKIHNPNNDSVIKLCNDLNFKQADQKIHIVYSDAYLDGTDGVFDMPYEQIISACDLSIFASLYEPWGYTPLESIAYGVPTITTDLAGFGGWISTLQQDYKDAVYVLPRKNKDENVVISTLALHLLDMVKRYQSHGQVIDAALRQKAMDVAALADWSVFYKDYLEAYAQAVKFNKLKFIAAESDSKFITSIQEPGVPLPRFHEFQYLCPLPDAIADLRNLACNLWWTWNDVAKILFEKTNPELWEQCKHNPLKFMNSVSSATFTSRVTDSAYMQLYVSTLAAFNTYMQANELPDFCYQAGVNSQNPVAYFCMEYGLDECLPIYSGGLGILAGDYLKAMSDLGVPMLAIGLFYKQGYFLQNVGSAGQQVAVYKTWDINQVPMRPVNDAAGKLILTGVEILGRTVYFRAWEVNVGRISLYLLDTNIPENCPKDREITNSLYGGDPEVRLRQEMVLGIGGARFIVEKLNIQPALYHLNEGHSAFLLLERVRYYCHQGLSFNEACELVRYSSVFTTHTPTAAGNEVFDGNLITQYFANYVGAMGITMERLLNLVRENTEQVAKFSMTALALRLTASANAVSLLHGKVARSMWHDIWPSLLELEVPIAQVTNGVHLALWLGSAMQSLYHDSLPSDWLARQDNADIWQQVNVIEDHALWRAHQIQKEQLLDLVKKLVVRQYALREESQDLVDATLQCLQNDVLLIGLSRRFTSYKRNDLILRDKAKLARIVNNVDCPVVILVAGKAHPADGGGQELIREFIMAMRETRFAGHIVFLEEYNIGLAKALVQGVDLWLNTPILGMEACGTSGMKVAINGGLNFSTCDGWWDEVYDSHLGWKIDSLVYIDDVEKRNDLESVLLLNALETEIAPLYYEKLGGEFSLGWVAKMKASLTLISERYNTYRMAKDYISKLYCHAVTRTRQVMQNDYAELKSIVAWKQGVIERFNTVKIKAILLDGIKDGTITSDGLLKIKVLIFPGSLNIRELQVEFVLLQYSDDREVAETTIVPLRLVDSRESSSEVLVYVEEHVVNATGFYSYGVRVLPYNNKLFRPQDVGVTYWG